MIKKFYTCITLASLLAMPTWTAANATIINADFETGNLSGWTSTFDGAVTTTFTSDLGTVYAPQSGSYFATLAAGAGEDVYSTLTSSTFFLQAGEHVSGMAAFDYRDFTDYNDSAYIKVLNTSGDEVAMPWFEIGGVVPDQGDTPWTSWSWTATTSGLYHIQLGVANNKDNDPSFSSVALIDKVIATPEPASLVLMGTGLAIASALRRKNTIV